MVVALAALTLMTVRVMDARSEGFGVNEPVVSRSITVPVEIIKAGEAPARREIRVER